MTLEGMVGGDDPAVGALPAQLALIDTGQTALPVALDDVTVESAQNGVVLRSATQTWPIPCRTWQLHRDVGAQFYAAIPPRSTPWLRRMAWRILLGVAATGLGRRWLARRAAA